MGGNPLRDAGVAALCAAVGASGTLRRLHIPDVQMTARGAQTVAALVRRGSLGSLKIGSNFIGHAGLRALCDAAGASVTLQELFLYDVNPLGDVSGVGVRCFTGMLRASRSLVRCARSS